MSLVTSVVRNACAIRAQTTFKVSSEVLFQLDPEEFTSDSTLRATSATLVDSSTSGCALDQRTHRQSGHNTSVSKSLYSYRKSLTLEIGSKLFGSGSSSSDDLWSTLNGSPFFENPLASLELVRESTEAALSHQIRRFLVFSSCATLQDIVHYSPEPTTMLIAGHLCPEPWRLSKAKSLHILDGSSSSSLLKRGEVSEHRD